MHHLRNVVTSHPPYRHTTPTSTSLYSTGQTGQQCPGAGTRCSWNIVHHLYIQVPPCPPPPHTHPHSPCRHTTPKSTSLYSPGQTGQHCPGTGLSRNIVRHLHIQVPPPHPPLSVQAHNTWLNISVLTRTDGTALSRHRHRTLTRNVALHLHTGDQPPGTGARHAGVEGRQEAGVGHVVALVVVATCLKPQLFTKGAPLQIFELYTEEVANQ